VRATFKDGGEREMDSLRAQKIGEALIEILGLKVNRKGRVKTSWGDKSPEGLAQTVERILTWTEAGPNGELRDQDFESSPWAGVKRDR